MQPALQGILQRCSTLSTCNRLYNQSCMHTNHTHVQFVMSVRAGQLAVSPASCCTRARNTNCTTL
jgi:hypothetical protein